VSLDLRVSKLLYPRKVTVGNLTNMSAQIFEKTNFGWQIQQQIQRFGEWVELITRGNDNRMPKVSWEPWFLDFLWLVVQGLFWVILTVLLIWLGWQLWRMWGHYLYSFPSLLNSPGENKVTEVNKLTVSAWLGRSREFYRQGNYTEAVRCLYLAMLQKLNDSGIILDEASRTDGEYRKLIQNLPQQEAYQLLLNTHENLCFGNSAISPEIFDRCQQAFQEIEKQ